MANNAATQGNLPMPTPFVASYATLFSDTSKDPLQGNYHDLMSGFELDINVHQNNPTPRELRDLIAAAGSQGHPIALGLINEGTMKVYLCPTRYERSLGAPVTNFDNLTYAFDGDLYNNQGISVEINNSFYDLADPNSILVPTVVNIVNQIAADPLLNIFDPLTAADAETEPMKCRLITPIPFKYVPIFLANEVTPRFYFETILPLITADNNAQDCLALTRYFQLAFVREAPNQWSPLDSVRPVAPGRNIEFLNRRDAVVQKHFPELNQGLAMLQQNQIAQQIASFTTMQQQNRIDDENRRLADKNQTVDKFLGQERLDRLLRLSRASTTANLAPIWKRMAASTKSNRLLLLQNMIDDAKDILREDHLTFIVDPALLQTVLSLKWENSHKDSLEHGLNPFRFGDMEIEQAYQRNATHDLILQGNANPSLSDAAELLKSKVSLPTPDSSNRYIRRMQILFTVLLPVGHSYTKWLKDHYDDMESFRPVFAAYQPQDIKLTYAKGIMHLKHVSLESSEYFKLQARSPSAIALPDEYEIRKAIEREKLWEPQLTHTFLSNYKVYAFCGVQVSNPLEAYMQSLNTGQPIVPPTAPPSGAGAGGGSGGGGGGDTVSSRINNVHFNATIFDEYRSRGIKSRTIKKAILANRKPPLPPSKTGTGVMCLPWHTKGLCNSECRLKADHIKYNATELKPLKDWCNVNYPTQAEAEQEEQAE